MNKCRFLFDSENFFCRALRQLWTFYIYLGQHVRGFSSLVIPAAANQSHAEGSIPDKFETYYFTSLCLKYHGHTQVKQIRRCEISGDCVCKISFRGKGQNNWNWKYLPFIALSNNHYSQHIMNICLSSTVTTLVKSGDNSAW